MSPEVFASDVIDMLDEMAHLTREHDRRAGSTPLRRSMPRAAGCALIAGS
jgi:hypothetical protein